MFSRLVSFSEHSNTDFYILDTRGVLVALSQFPVYAATIHAHSDHIDTLEVISLPYQQVYEQKVHKSSEQKNSL